MKKGVNMRIRIFVILVTGLFLTSCGGNAETDVSQPAEAGAEEDMVELEITATIGVELGDSNYVLGSVQRIDHDAQGNILVLDRSACCVRVYTPDGEFVRQISNQGSGPGELINPLDMAVLQDGRIIVETPWSGGLHGFTSEGEWLGILTPFYNNPPMGTVAADDSAYVASRLEVIPDESGDIICNAFIGRYELGELPVITYWENSFPFDPNDLTGLLMNSILGNVFTADPNGNVFIAEQTSDEYLLKGYTAEGELFLEIERDMERVEKTAAEIEDEIIYVEALLESMGANGVVIEWIPDPFRNMISELEVDGEEKIWVRRGTSDEPVFDVYDYHGNLLFTAYVPEAGTDAAYWNFNIDEHGIIAYSANPELYQQIYVLQLSGEFGVTGENSLN